MRGVVCVLLVVILASMVVGPSAPAKPGGVLGDVRPAVVPPLATIPSFPNVKITDGTSPYQWQVEPTMVLDQTGRIFVGWKETNSPEAAGIRVGFSYSADDGQSWAPNILMEQSHPNQGCHNSDPWLARGPDQRVHFAYLEYDCGSGINVANTTDGGTWQPPNYLLGSGGLSDKESLAVDPNGRLYLAWDEAGLGNEMQVTWSDDGGATWAPFVNPASSSVLGVIVATSPNGTVYLTWWNLNSNDIMFDWSSDGGQTWHPDVRVNSVSGSANGGGWQIPIPAMNVDPSSGTIYIAWPDARNGNQDIYIASSSDGGGTWSSNVRINDDSGATTQYMVDLAVDSAGTVHAAWEDKRSGDWEIYYANSTDRGQAWTPNAPVTTEVTPGTYNRPGDYFAIEAGPDDSINVVWTDGRGENFDIYFARKQDAEAVSVTVSTDPLGLDVTVDGVTAPSPISRTWLLGSSHTVGVTSPIPIAAGSRYEWRSWSDGGAMTHTVIALTDSTLTASFAKQHQISIGMIPGGRTVLVDNVPITSRATYWWDDSSSHSIDAPLQPDATAEHRYEWRSWSDGASRAHAIVPTGPLSLTATFAYEESLHVSTSPQGLEFIVDDLPYTSEHTFWYEPHSEVAVFAPISQAGEGTRYTFVEWSDGGTAAHILTFTGATSLEATYRTEYYLDVTSPVAGTTGSGWYSEGVIAYASVLATLVSRGSGVRDAFVGWTDDASGIGKTSTGILMDGPKAATAVWRTEYFLQVESDVGIVPGTGWYPAGTSVTLEVPEQKMEFGTTYRFVGWSGDVASTERTIMVTMEGPKNVRATWQPTGSLEVLSSPFIGFGILAVIVLIAVGILIVRRRRHRD